MISIKQNPSFAASEFREPGNRLPDLRNLGVCLRILIVVNVMALIAAILQVSSFPQVLQKLAELSVMLQPVLLLSLLLLYVIYPVLKKLPYKLGIGSVIGLEVFLTWLAHQLGASLFGTDAMPSVWRLMLLSLIMTLIVLAYFNLRARALSPAISEARVQALQARIRPHFLFNSINAVLSIVRTEPKRAEAALEDMADLFRVLMADNRELVPLAQEIGLCRQYLALEKLRLEDRLHVDWQIDNIPPDALIPPLILQPLLENAVYHGVEPMPEGGTLTIHIRSTPNEVHIILSNPFLPQNDHHAGNKMALKNIRERLSLHFDVEANLKSHAGGGLYQVEITVPYHRES
jgi:two-component system, LytTR family, sensor histidine kinase AlgZ